MTNDGQTVSPGKQSKVVNCIIDFLSPMNKGQAISINLQSVANVSPLDKILMVYVDNELNSQNVTILFPDTQQYVGVPAYTTGYYPVLTGGQLAVVYNGTTGQVPVTANSQVSVIFCNFAVPGFLSQETLSITFNSSNGPIIPTIGDQVITQTYNATTGAFDITILPLLALPKQYVITGVQVSAVNLFSSGDYPATAKSILIFLDSSNPTYAMRQFVVDVSPSFEGTRYQVICDETGLNIPVQTVTFGINYTGGSIPYTFPPWASVTVSLTYAEISL